MNLVLLVKLYNWFLRSLYNKNIVFVMKCIELSTSVNQYKEVVNISLFIFASGIDVENYS